MTPQRIQRKRTRGFKMPPNTVYVGRPTRFGNPYIVGRDGTAEECVRQYEAWLLSEASLDDIRRTLRGRNLACWCPLSQACHADMLLRIAND